MTNKENIEVLNQHLGTDTDLFKELKWENKPTVKELLLDYTEAKAFHEDHVLAVNKSLSIIEAKYSINHKNPGRSSIQPKLARKQAEWRYASLEEPFLSAPKLFNITPAGSLDQDAAKLNELILNKQFREDIPRVQFINDYIRTAVNTGTVIMKISWERSKTNLTKVIQEPVYAKSIEEAIPFLQQLIQNGEIDEAYAQQLLESSQPIVIGLKPKTVKTGIPKVNRPIIELRNSKNVVIDPTCNGDMSKARFIIDSYYTDLATLKASGSYTNLDKVNLEDTRHTDVDTFENGKLDGNTQFNFKDKYRKKVALKEYWGYWDINDNGVLVPIVASWIGDTMVRLEENPYPDKELPFVVVRYLPVLNSVYGESDALLLEDNQHIIGALTRGILDTFSKSANAQTAFKQGALSPQEKKRFQNGEDYEVSSIYGPINENIYLHTMKDVPTSVLNVLAMQNNEAEALTGIKAFSNGISGESLGSSVGGIRSALDATSKRESSILKRLAQGIIDIGKKIVALNAENLTDEEVVYITDEETITVNRSQLNGRFNLALTVATAETEKQKAEELSFMLQTLGASALPFELTKEILAEIANLIKLPNLANNIRKYEPQPDPIAQEKAMLEIELLKAQINDLTIKAEENKADIGLKGIKAKTEAAKARKLGSEADLSDLEYLDNATGIKQDRDIEKINASSNAKITSDAANKFLNVNLATQEPLGEEQMVEQPNLPINPLPPQQEPIR